MFRIFLCAALLAASQGALAQDQQPERPQCPETHYPCGQDSCCSR